MRIYERLFLRLAGRLERQRVDVFDDLPDFLLRQRALGARRRGTAGGHRRAGDAGRDRARRHRSAAGRRGYDPSRKLRGIALRGGKSELINASTFVVFLLGRRICSLKFVDVVTLSLGSSSSFSDSNLANLVVRGLDEFVVRFAPVVVVVLLAVARGRSGRGTSCSWRGCRRTTRGRRRSTLAPLEACGCRWVLRPLSE